MTWVNLDKSRPDSAHYSVMRNDGSISNMEALRAMFPDGMADEMNAVLFSTSGVHGTYQTVEEAEAFLKGEPGNDGYGEVTFVIVHPRLVALRYGCCTPETQDDIDFLKKLRASSHAAFAEIGLPPKEQA